MTEAISWRLSKLALMKNEEVFLALEPNPKKCAFHNQVETKRPCLGDVNISCRRSQLVTCDKKMDS